MLGNMSKIATDVDCFHLVVVFTSSNDATPADFERLLHSSSTRPLPGLLTDGEVDSLQGNAEVFYL